MMRRFGEGWERADGINLRWRTPDEPNGRRKITIRYGEYYSIPIAMRDDSAEHNGTAWITNEDSILSNQVNRKWILEPGRLPPVSHPVGRFDFKIELRRGKKRWRSDIIYIIRVPPAGISNAFFSIEAMYE
jgi:hypothetical protein